MGEMAMIVEIFLVLALSGVDADTIKCVRVIDGDTIVLEDGRRVRLSGIDAPEAKQPWGEESTNLLRMICEGQQVRVIGEKKDFFGRVLAVIEVDGLDVNHHQVQAGLAWHYKKYSKDKELAEAEKAARKASRGIWRDDGAIAPWDWRKGKRGEK